MTSKGGSWFRRWISALSATMRRRRTTPRLFRIQRCLAAAAVRSAAARAARAPPDRARSGAPASALGGLRGREGPACSRADLLYRGVPREICVHYSQHGSVIRLLAVPTISITPLLSRSSSANPKTARTRTCTECVDALDASRARLAHIRRDTRSVNGTHAGPCRSVNWTAVCVRTVADRVVPSARYRSPGPLVKVCHLAVFYYVGLEVVAASGGKWRQVRRTRCVARDAAHPITRCYEMPPLGTEAVHTPLASVKGFSM